MSSKVSAFPRAQKPGRGVSGVSTLQEQGGVDGELIILGMVWGFGKWSGVCAGVWGQFLFPKGLLPVGGLCVQTMGRRWFSPPRGWGSAPPYLKYERMQTATMREAREME